MNFSQVVTRIADQVDHARFGAEYLGYQAAEWNGRSCALFFYLWSDGKIEIESFWATPAIPDDVYRVMVKGKLPISLLNTLWYIARRAEAELSRVEAGGAV